MLFPSSVAVEQSVLALNYRNTLEKIGPIRTKGFWHVLIALRHIRLQNLAERSFEVQLSYDMAEACFDLNGISLPIGNESRQVYYEPAASSGSNPGEYFRHREGPRQTYQNRIQTGLGGGGPRQPHFFDVSSASLPTAVTFRKNWIEEFRSYEPHAFLLDTRITDLFCYIFRFGIPHLGGITNSIAVHTGNGSLSLRDNIAFGPLDPADFKANVLDFFGITDAELSALFPQFNKINFPHFTEIERLPFDVLSFILKRDYLVTDSGADTSEGEASQAGMNWNTFAQEIATNCSFVGSPQTVDKCMAALNAGKNLLLLGAPGGGKTLLAKQLCKAASASGIAGYVLATATSEWSTFETIGGYMPSRENPNVLEFSPGVITSAIIANKWLLIDEFNRADIDKAFGEMFTLLSGHKVQLSHNKDGKPVCIQDESEPVDSDMYTIPLSKSWRIIATMNTFDKSSLFEMSYALMRRFAAIEVDLPDTEALGLILQESINCLNVFSFSDEDKAFITTWINAFFASDSDPGLCKINLQLGPAIAQDMLAYLTARLAKLSSFSREELVDTSFEAVEMYVFPQFEGRDLLHETIVDMVCQVGFATKTKALISKKLSLWTGYEEG